MAPTRLLAHSIRRTSFRTQQMRSNSTTQPRTKPLALPRLPVPDLRKTLDRYLTSLQPLLLEDELRNGTPYHSAYSLRAKWADTFESGIGKVCQERLLALDRESPYNWLDDNFWIDKAYLEWRAPLVVNSNWWLAFHNDNMIPEEALKSESKHKLAGITPWQVRRAAWLLHRMLDFKGKLDTQELHPETTRTGIWFRENTAKLFNIARIPKPQCDTLSIIPSPTSPSARNLFLMIHDWCYTVTVYHPDQPGQQLINVKELESRIRAVVRDAERRLSAGEQAVPVAVLSSDNRDKWAENLEYLLSLSPKNKATHQAILDSLMGLSLDHETHTIRPPPPSSPFHASPQQLEVDAHLHTIRSTPNAHNRFFDKPLTLIVDASTRAGAMGEHSPCDALVPSIVAEYGVVEGIDVDAFGDGHDGELSFLSDIGQSEATADGKGWERLEWEVDDRIRQECVEAEERARAIIGNSDDSVLWFTDYGTDWIKGSARLAPDAYIQMVLQLAWYKTRGEFTATYETVLTRMFQRGRTETIRTLTQDSRAFVLAMVDPNVSARTRYALLRRAIQTHTSLTREAATGKGIDRHLLGLRLMLRPEDGECAELFEDELFERSARWKLSTSGLSAGHLFRGTGFGAMYEDGYGINYLAAPDMVKFGIESKFSSPLTSTDGFKAAILEALKELRVVCSVEVVEAHDIRSHL